MYRSQLSIAVILALLPFVASADLAVVGVQEWRQVTDTVGLTYSQVATVCDTGTGVCNGSVGGVEFTGWTWASLDDIGTLFAALTPYPGGQTQYFESDSEWAPLFFELFAPTQITNERRLIEGLSRELFTDSAALTGLLVDWFDPSITDSAIVRSTADDSDAFRVGAWLFKDAPIISVPEPGTLGLLIIGLAGIRLVRSRTAA